MTAPSAKVRGTPSGIMLDDGHSTKIAMENLLTISFWEKSTGVPPIDGGDEIPQTTHHNTAWRTFAPRHLKTLEPFSVDAAYDPLTISQTIDQINVRQTLTTIFPDGSTLAFYGYLKRWEAAPLVEGEQPEGTATFVPTNADPSTGAEEAPVYVDVSGT